MRITYDGPTDGVMIPQLHQVVVERGQTIEVDDELGARLIEQLYWDTSLQEVLGFLNRVEDYDARVDWARRLVTAEQDGAQRGEVLDALTVWLTAQQPDLAGDPGGGDPDAVPAGTVEEILAWVGDNRDRAGRALEAEWAGKNRPSLIAQLERLSTKESD